MAQSVTLPELELNHARLYGHLSGYARANNAVLDKFLQYDMSILLHILLFFFSLLTTTITTPKILAV